MKKLFAFAAATLFTMSMQAQETVNPQLYSSLSDDDEVTSIEDFIPDHMGASLGIGTTGITFDLSTRFSQYIGLRAGVDFVPKLKLGTELDLTQASSAVTNAAAYQSILTANGISALPSQVDVEGKLSMTTWHVLIDVYPFASVNSFHITAGAYFGSDDIIEVYNKEDGALKAVTDYNKAVRSGGSLASYNVDPIGVQLGDYFFEPDSKGNAKASIRVNKFRPYIGVGFGRAVPKTPIGVSVDLGAQFWGSPSVYAFGDAGEHKLSESDTNGDAGKILKMMSKISVYPTLTVRLTGKIF